MNAIERLRQIDDAYHRLKTLLSAAHVALLDSGVSVPDFDQDISPAIRELTAERDRLKSGLSAVTADRDRLKIIAKDLAEVLEEIKINYLVHGRLEFWADMILHNARSEGVIE